MDKPRDTLVLAVITLQELYRRGNTKVEFYHILEKNMQPVYESAKRQGYLVW